MNIAEIRDKARNKLDKLPALQKLEASRDLCETTAGG